MAPIESPPPDSAAATLGFGGRLPANWLCGVRFAEKDRAIALGVMQPENFVESPNGVAKCEVRSVSGKVKMSRPFVIPSSIPHSIFEFRHSPLLALRGIEAGFGPEDADTFDRDIHPHLRSDTATRLSANLQRRSHLAGRESCVNEFAAARKTPIMALRYDGITTTEGLRFLRHCYKYVNNDWQRATREALPDQGFELLFRRFCVTTLNGWQVSQEWELGLGSELTTASGVRHEIDLVARNADLLVIAELKNKPGCPPGKNDVIIFFSKILDYLAHNPKVLLSEVLPVFVSSCAFEEATLAACLGLGIHPVAPGLRPLPLLADSLERIQSDIARGLVLPERVTTQWEDACAGINRLGLGLGDTWLSARCGYVSDQVINLRATLDADSYEMSRELRQANGDCSSVLGAIRLQKAAE